jgi:PAS domain S-box-containing protein
MINASSAILLIEDDFADVQSIQDLLSAQEGFQFELNHADCMAEAIRYLMSNRADVVLLDLTLPDCEGLASIERLQPYCEDIPIIVLAEGDEKRWGADALGAGAQDYLTKGRIDAQLLARSIRYAMERKRTDEALLHSERRFRKLIENSQDAFVLDSPDGVILYASASTERMLGYALDEMVGHNFAEFVHPDDMLKQVGPQYAQLVSSPSSVIFFSERVLHKDGSWRWIEGTGQNLLHDPDVAAIVFNFRDVTDRKQAEDAQNYLASIVASSHDAIFSTTLDGIIQTWNVAAEQIYGYTAQEIIGQSVSITVPPEKAGEEWKNIERVLSGERVTNFETIRLRKDGQRISISLTLSPIRDARGQPVAISAISRDVTRQKETFEAIRFQAQLLDAVGQAVVAIDLSGSVVYWNRTAEQFYGWRAEEVIGENAARLIPNTASKTDAESLLSKVKTGERWSREYQVQRKDGTLFPAWVTDSPIYDSDGKLIGIVGIAVDITERKRMEQALTTSEQFARATVDALSSHIAIIDETGRIVAVNQAWRQFAESNPPISSHVFEGVNYLAVCDNAVGEGAEEAARMAAGIRAVLQGERETFTMEYSCHSPDENRWFMARVTRFKGDGPVHVVIAHENITDRVIAHEHTRQLIDMLGERNRNLIIIHEIGQMLAATFEKEEIYRILYREVAGELLKAPHFLMALYDEQSQTIYCDFAVVDEKEASLSWFPVVPLGSGPNSQAILTRQPQVVDIALDKMQGQQMSVGEVPRNPRSGLYLPLIASDKVIGVMCVQRYEEDAFAGIDLTFLMTLASQAANSLEKAQLYDTLRSSASELSSLYNATSYLFKADSILNLSHQIVQAVVAEFGHVDCGLIILDKENNIVRVARTGARQVVTDARLELNGPGLVPEALRTRQPVYVPNVGVDPRYVRNNPDTQSELVIPLHTLQGVIGALDLQSTEIDAFTLAQRRVLAAFSERVAAAIENMLLYEELNQHAAELEWRVARRTAELHRTKDRVEAILNNNSDAIILTNLDGHMQQTNPAFMTLFGLEFEEIFGEPLASLFVPEQHQDVSNFLNAVISTGASHRGELKARRKNGTSFDADVAFAPILNDTEDPRIVCSLRDITERKRMEEELRRALQKEKELNELKSRFVSMVSHEFRTPLATILSSSDLIKRYNQRMTEERKQEHLQTIQVQVKRLTGMLEDILTIGKAETVGLSINPSLIELKPFCQEIVEEMQMIAPTHRFDFSVIREGAPVMLDGKLMRRAITNLLSNAVKYSPPGSTIFFSVCGGNRQTMFYIRDQGIGIPAEDQAHLFEVFHRAQNVGTVPGTGLGLAIVKQAVDAHLGTVTVHSEPGKGTMFSVSIPVVGHANDGVSEDKSLTDNSSVSPYNNS